MSSDAPSTATSTMDKDALRKFYFSGGANFGSYKAAQEKRAASSHGRNTTTTTTDMAGPMTVAGRDASALSLGGVNVSMPSTIQDGSVTATTTQPVADVEPVDGPSMQQQVVAKVGISGLRSMNQSRGGSRPTTQQSAGPKPDAASAEYIRFLKQQQELQTHHNRLDSAVRALCDGRRQQQASLAKMRREAAELLKEVEESGDWKLRTKYDLKQLTKDAGLGLQLMELIEDLPPRLEGVQHLTAELDRIRTEYADAESFRHHRLLLDQAVRRLGFLERVMADGAVDSAEVCRIPDSLVVHLEKVSALPPIEDIVKATEEAIERSTFKIEEARKERAVAIEDGEVHVAEKLCYEIVEEHEAMLEHVLNKVELMADAIKDADVLEQVRTKYHTTSSSDFDKLQTKSNKLKDRCEDDVKKLFALREKVEEMEALAAQKVEQDRQRSDAALCDNTQKTEIAFAKIEELEREIDALERERHKLVQQRIATKDKDEHRRAEFAQFCKTVDDHLRPLERTLKGMDVTTHSINVLGEFSQAAYDALQEELSERTEMLQQVKTEAHKQHVETFRGLLLELGEVVYKKERMIEETDKSIQQAHIQQELLAETFNPSAKKFGDVKKRLLATRDDLEGDVTELKERASAALKAFGASEAALNKAGVSFVHPVTEQDQHTLALRTRMVEFKALATGHVEGQKLLREISELKSEMHHSRQEMDTVNASTSGTINKTLPLIRAAQKARPAA